MKWMTKPAQVAVTPAVARTEPVMVPLLVTTTPALSSTTPAVAATTPAVAAHTHAETRVQETRAQGERWKTPIVEKMTLASTVPTDTATSVNATMVPTARQRRWWRCRRHPTRPRRTGEGG